MIGRSTFVASLLLLSACGMTDDPREEQKRATYPKIPDPAFSAYLLENYDLNRDGRFSYYEAERILVIDCPGRDIVTLAGVEYCVQLRELNCADNLIENLDLSQNLLLEVLDCSRNALYEIRFGHMRELRELRCAENLLSQLEVINTPALHTIDCATNELRLLDISNCARTMRWVDARFNPLEILYKSPYQTIEYLQPGSGEVVDK